MKEEKIIRMKRELFEKEIKKLNPQEKDKLLLYCNELFNRGETILEKLRIKIKKGE